MRHFQPASSTLLTVVVQNGFCYCTCQIKRNNTTAARRFPSQLSLLYKMLRDYRLYLRLTSTPLSVVDLAQAVHCSLISSKGSSFLSAKGYRVRFHPKSDPEYIKYGRQAQSFWARYFFHGHNKGFYVYTIGWESGIICGVCLKIPGATLYVPLDG